MTDNALSNINTIVKTIPESTPPEALFTALQPVLSLLSALPPIVTLAWLNNTLKPRFNLKGVEIDAYASEIKRMAAARTTTAEEGDEDYVTTRSLVPGLIYWTRDTEGHINYLMHDPTKSPAMRVCEQVTIDGVDCRPKNVMSFLLPSPNITQHDYGTDFKRLLDDVEAFIKSYVELPEDKNYLPLALWVLHTYLIEHFDSTCILYFHGQLESGKSRAGQVLNALAFRCERITSPTEAVMFRSAHYFKNALILDEIKLLGPDGNKSVEQLLKNRYKRGMTVPRVDLNIREAENQIVFYDTFGPCALCTTEGVDNIIGSRCIKYTMVKNSRPEVERPIDLEAAEQLRERLLYFRLHYFDKQIPYAESPKRRRLGEKTIALYQTLLLCDPERVKDFATFLDELEGEDKSEQADTFDAEIFSEILTHIEGRDHFTVKDILGILNSKLTKDDKFRHSAQSIGRHIARMGFKKGPRSGKERIWHWTPELIQRLKDMFDIKDTTAASTAPASTKEESQKIEQGDNLPF